MVISHAIIVTKIAGQKPNRRFSNKPKLPFFERNNFIQASEMLVITDGGENLGVLDRQTALNKSYELGSDLVLINPQANPPVAKIIAWSKFKYEQSKKKKKTMKNKGGELKEMWFKPFIEIGDLTHKVDRIKEFLSKGNKVKVTIRANRGPVNREKMQETMSKVLEMLNSVAEPEGEKKFEGRNIIIFLKPKN